MGWWRKSLAPSTNESVGDPVDEGPEPDVQLPAGQRGTEAVVGAEPEREVLADVAAIEVEVGGALEP